MTTDFFRNLRGDPDAAAPPESVREERRQDKSSRFIAVIESAGTAGDKVNASAEWILTEFDAYYLQSRRIPGLAQHAFEARDAALSVELSHQRLSLYGTNVANLAADLRRVFPEVASDESLWESIEARYLPMIEGRYEADLAFAFFHSVRRIVYQGRMDAGRLLVSRQRSGARFPHLQGSPSALRPRRRSSRICSPGSWTCPVSVSVPGSRR